MDQLLLFQTIFTDEIGQALLAWHRSRTREDLIEFARALWREERSLQEYLIERVLLADNRFTRAAEAGAVSAGLMAVAQADLDQLGALMSVLDGQEIPLPAFEPPTTGLRAKLAATPAWGALASELAAHYRQHGAGDEGRYHAFRWEEGRLVGIAEPDPIRLEDLVGYEEARQTVIRNTEQWLAGYPANNLLLYGDRGTGKSSTVKALVHRYGPAGLRLVEVPRTSIGQIAQIMRLLRTKAQRFILMIDDLSFESGDGDYKSFKAMMEGSIEQRPANVLVYVTTNRMHLLRERHSDRSNQDEVHPKDTIQEMASLSDRFGMTVLFTAPDQEQYLQIVGALARQRGIDLPEAELRQQAIRWALWQNGQSGRTARQFIDDLCGKLGLPL
jgi:predicted AAA+ superfamily ATPase